MNYIQQGIIIISFFLIHYLAGPIRFNGVQKIINVEYGEFGKTYDSFTIVL